MAIPPENILLQVRLGTIQQARQVLSATLFVDGYGAGYIAIITTDDASRQTFVRLDEPRLEQLEQIVKDARAAMNDLKLQDRFKGLKLPPD